MRISGILAEFTAKWKVFRRGMETIDIKTIKLCAKFGRF